MKIVNVTELRQNLPGYLARVRRGESIKVSSRGKIIAELVPAVPSPDDLAARRALDRWYRAQCRDLVSGCLPEIADQMGVAPGRVTIREAQVPPSN